MDDSMNIGELAQRAGVRPSTIRYYERQELLRPDARTSANYRRYGLAALARLRFIRAAQASGLSLRDIRTLLAFRDGDSSPCDEVRSIVEVRLGEVDRQLRDLRQIRDALRHFRDACEGTTGGAPCPVLDELEHRPAKPGGSSGRG